MKLIFFILISSIASAQVTDVRINSGTLPLTINTGASPVRVNYGFGYHRFARDDGYYNGFPMLADVYDGESTIGVYKKSFTHGGAGYLMLIRTTDGGRHWSEDSIRVDGSVIHSTNHSFYRFASGRLVISYKLNGDTSIRFAWNNDDDVNFTSSATVITPPGNYNYNQSPSKMCLTSYGTLLFTYYAVGSNGNPAKGVIMESEDEGATFSQKCEMYSHNTVANALPITDWRGNEIEICETHPTANETTSKWIAFVRTEQANDGGTYPLVFKSSDGANTWYMDSTTDAGSFVDDLGNTVTSSTFYRDLNYSFLTTNSPFSIRLIGDSVYVVCGERNPAYGYALKVISATPDGAFENKFSNWTRPRLVKRYYNGSGIGSSTDSGYPVIFTWGGNSFGVAQYDVSTGSPLPGVTRRCLIETVRIK